MNKHVVILGGGIGGLATAYNLRKLSRNLKITLISDRPYFGFTPAYPHLAMGWRRFEDITVPLASLLPRFGIEFVNERAESIDPDRNRVRTAERDPGSSSISKVRKNTQLPYAQPSTPSIPRGSSRNFTGIPDEPYLGHLGLGGVGPSRRMMEDLFAEKDIRFITNAKVKSIGEDRVVYEDSEGREHEVPAKFTMFMPRFEGPHAVASAGDKLANPRNKMLVVNRCFQNPTYRNLYGVGVVTAIPPVEPTPVPTGTPKTGQMIEGMAAAVALNIVNDMSNSPDRYAPTLAAVCIADMGKEAVFFAANPVIPPRAWVKTKKGMWVHYLKTAFEKYFLWKVKSGNMSPWFEEKALELLLHMKNVELCRECEGPPGSRC